MVDRSRVPDVGICSCGKRKFIDRRTARRVARIRAARYGRMDAYPCGDYWHVGHLLPAIVKGEATRGDTYGR